MILEQLKMYRDKNNLYLNFRSYTESQLKDGCGITCKTIKLIEKKLGENIWNLRLEGKLISLDFIKLKNFSSVKDPVYRMKRPATFEGKYLQAIYLKRD